MSKKITFHDIFVGWLAAMSFWQFLGVLFCLAGLIIYIFAPGSWSGTAGDKGFNFPVSFVVFGFGVIFIGWQPFLKGLKAWRKK